jgi:hypothetical protein
MMETISWNDFEKVELRVGRVVSAEPFPEARKPAYILHVDFGEAIGTAHVRVPDHRISQRARGSDTVRAGQTRPTRNQAALIRLF